MSGSLAVAMNAHGALEVFVRGIDGVLCHKWQTKAGAGPWSDWESLGAPSNLKMSNLLAVATNGGLRDMHAFVVGTDNALWHIWFKDQQDAMWDQWESFGGVVQSVLGVQLNQDDRLEVFSQGTDGALWHTFQMERGGSVWSGWRPLGGLITAPMHVARNQDGRLEVFVRGRDGDLLHNYQTKPGDPRQPDGGPWSGWASLGGSIAEALVAGYDNAGRQHVFAQWTDGSVRHIYQTVANHGPWSNEVTGTWESLGGVITGLLVLNYNQDGRIDLFARGKNNDLLHNYQIDPNSGPWVGSDWKPLGGEIKGVLKTFFNADYRMEVFADRSDGALWHIWQGKPNDESSWSDWDSLGVIPFFNYGKTLMFQPSATVEPTNLADLVAMVRGAENSNQRAHAFGSGWSFSDCVRTNDVLIDTGQLNSTIPRAQAVQQALKSSYSQDPNLLYHIQGGITIRDLYQRLDNFVDPGTRQPRPLALETMADSAGQTLAGAISTGSHGADKLFGFFQFTPPMADSVLAIHLVGTSGTQYWIEPSQGITDPDKLRQFVAPGANIIYDDKTFNAVLVSLGCMGVVYSLVLRVRDQFNLIETTIETTWKGFQAKFFTWINDPANRYLKAILVPYIDSTGDSPCLVITRAIANPQSGKPDRLNSDDSLKVGESITSQNDLFTLVLQGDGNLVLYWSGGPAIWGAGTEGKSVAQAIMQGDGNFVMYGPQGEYVWDTATDNHPGAFLIVQNDGNVVIYDQGGNYLWDTGTNNTSCGGDPKQTKQAVTDMVAEMVGVFPFSHGLTVKGILETPGDQYGRLVEAINYILEQAAELRPVLVKHYPSILRALWPAGTCGGKSYGVADLVNRGPRNASSGGAYSIEVAVKAYDDQNNLTFAPFVNDLLMAVATANNTFLAGWLALRFTGGTRASLGMQQWPLTCHVEVSTVPGVDRLKELLGTILGLGYNAGGLPHMGQMLDIAIEPGGRIYPRFQEWRDVYQQISGGKHTFANALSDRWQLTTPPLGTISVGVELNNKVGTRHTIKVTVTDSATRSAIQGATVAVFNAVGGEQATGTTDSQGAVSLTYTRCLDPETHTEMECDGTVSKDGYQNGDFITPI